MPTCEVLTIEPLIGKPEGGDTVTVHGHHLEEITEVSVGDAGQVTPAHVSDSELTFVTPPLPAGGAHTDRHMGLVFHTSSGEYVSGESMVFVFEGHVPLILAVEPSYVHPAGGDVVEVSGEHVDQIVHVEVGVLGTVEATPVRDGVTSFVAPAMPQEQVASEPSMGLVFYQADGTFVSWPNGLVYAMPFADGAEHSPTEHTPLEHEQPLTPLGRPTIEMVQPPNGPVAGGDWVSVTGTHLISAVSVTFGGVPAHFSEAPDNALYAYPPPYDAATMGNPEVAVEVHSEAHGVSTEHVVYRYDVLRDTTAGDPRGLGDLGSSTVASPGANIGSGTSDQIQEPGPQ